jgi:hypothetical protein
MSVSGIGGAAPKPTVAVHTPKVRTPKAKPVAAPVVTPPATKAVNKTA